MLSQSFATLSRFLRLTPSTKESNTWRGIWRCVKIRCSWQLKSWIRCINVQNNLWEHKIVDILQAVTAADDSDRMRKVFESKASGVSTFCLYLWFKTSGVRISLHPYFAYILTFLHIMIPQDEDRMVKLEDELKAVRTKAEEADKAYDEVFKKIQVDNIQDMPPESFLGAQNLI